MSRSVSSSSTESLITRRLLFWLLVICLFFGLLYLLRAMLLPFVLGMLAAYFLDPAADRLEKWGFGRGAATATITALFFGLLILLGITLLPALANQISGLMADLPQYIARLREALILQLDKLPLPDGMQEHLNANGLIDKLLISTESLALGIFQSGMFLINIASLLIITPVVTFYLLRDWDHLIEKIDYLLPRKHAATIREQLGKIDDTLAGFIRGQLNVMLLLGCFYSLLLLSAGLKYGVIIGILSGLLIIIPYAGAGLSGIMAVAIAYLQFDGDMARVGVIAAIYIAGQMLEGYFLTPRLVGERVGLHPVWVIFGMLAGAALFGFVGVLIAVPVSAVIGVLVRFAIDRYLHSSFYSEQ